MIDEDERSDAVLFARLRALWRAEDPEPADLAERMIAAVAMEDVAREYTLLALLEPSMLAVVRGETDTATLQFGDGRTNVLLHVTATEDGSRRIDGWVDAEALAIRIAQGDREWTGAMEARGRFAFDAIPPGLSKLRLVVRGVDGEQHEFQSPQFEA